MIRKALGTIMGSVLALAFMSFLPSACADEVDQATQLTFRQPIQIPGNQVLPAGTYWLVVPDAGTGGNIVQIYSADRSHLLATLEANTTERLESSEGHTQLTFVKLSRNGPALLVSWFYPDQTEGHRFVYSAQREIQIAGANRIAVIPRKTVQVG